MLELKKTLSVRLLIAVLVILGLHLAVTASFFGLRERTMNVWLSNRLTLLQVLGALCVGTRWVSDAFLLLWLTWGAGSLVRRLLAVIVVAAMQRACDLLLATLFVVDEQLVVTFGLELIVVAFALLSGHALMFPLREALGWQLAFMPPERTSHGSGVRWSLLQLVGWTSFLAFAFAFARLVMDIDLQGDSRALLVLTRILSEGLVRLVMLVAVLHYWCTPAATRQRGWIIAGALLFDAGSQLLWSWLDGYGPAWAESLITSLGTLAAALVIVRSLHWAGLRLYRHGGSPIPAVESSAGNPVEPKALLTPASH